MGLEALETVVQRAMRATREAQEAEAAEKGTTPEELAGERQRLNKRKERAHALIGSGLLVDAADVDLIADSTFEVTPAIEFVKKWAERPDAPRILIMCGNVGIGKTFAAGVAIASAGGANAVKSIELATRVHPFAADLARGVVPLDLKHPFVVLDDLGTESDQRERRWSEAFALFVEHRQMYGRTLITTNLRRTQLRRRYDRRIVDRLNACGRAVDLAGESRRAKRGGL